ncbi:hypothetical protein NMY22_g19303 [Coprinellus aureogranulatus]|nr:hypothetical protein NMY22_g19303 [Coprinellus aureogranulatus]
MPIPEDELALSSYEPLGIRCPTVYTCSPSCIFAASWFPSTNTNPPLAAPSISNPPADVEGGNISPLPRLNVNPLSLLRLPIIELGVKGTLLLLLLLAGLAVVATAEKHNPNLVVVVVAAAVAVPATHYIPTPDPPSPALLLSSLICINVALPTSSPLPPSPIFCAAWLGINGFGCLPSLLAAAAGFALRRTLRAPLMQRSWVD